MKKLILTAILVSTSLAHADYPKQEQVECQLSDLGAVTTILIESGTDNLGPGTLTLLGADGVIEKVNPTPGIGGVFNEYKFPSYFRRENDAIKPQRLKFETRQLGPIYLSYICNRPNALFCEDRGGIMIDSARVAININGKRILNFNGSSLPLCHRKVLE